MRVWIGILLVLSCGLLVLFVFMPDMIRDRETGGVKIGDAPPRITVSDLNGYAVTIPDDLEGRTVIIHFWAVTCSRCLEELAVLQAIYENYRDRGLVVIAINVGQTGDKAREFAVQAGVSYLVFLDPEGKIAERYGINGVPRTLILERSGHLRYKILGEVAQDKLEKLVLKAL